MGKISTSYQSLAALVASTTDDIEKADGGNKAAAVRSRKVMQQIKAAAQQVRKDLLVDEKTK